VYAVVDDYRDQRDLELGANAELARAVAGAFDGFVRSVLRTEHAVGVSAVLHGTAAMNEELARVKAEFPEIRYLSWVDPRGHVRSSTEPGLVGRSVFARDYFQHLLDGDPWHVGPLVRSLVDEAPVFVIARAVRGTRGELVGAVAAAVDADRLDSLLGARARRGRISIIDSAGTLVARQSPGETSWAARRAAADHPRVRRALGGVEEVGIYRWPPSRDRRIGALVPIPSIGWVAQASRPLDEALAPVRRLAIWHAIVMLGVVASALAAALLLARRIAVPLRALERHAALLAGEGEARAPARGPSEVQRVALSLESMAARLAKRRADLEAANRRLSESEERFRLLAAAAEAHGTELEAVLGALPVGLAIVDVAGHVIRVNDLAREMLGASPEDVSRFRVSLPDGRAVPERDQPLDRALRGETVRGEVLRVERPSGAAPTWLAANAAPIRGPGGDLRGAVVALLDVTELHELQEERETLMQTVSHDLRTPLHAIVGHAEILRRRGDDEARRRAETILASAGRMTRLIGDLVDAARLEAGHLALLLEPVDLVAYLGGWKERMAGALEMERVRIRAPDAVPAVLADAGRLEQILVNLVSNALKYSLADSEVQIELVATAGALRLSVADRGPGIPPEELPRLFERYYRAKSASRTEGLGLGLFITRKLVDAHGWRIEVASEPGRGSVFTVVVPLAGSSRRSFAA
jgi:PAS domain S-box-containing protein